MIEVLLQALVIGAACAGLGWLLSHANRRWSAGQSELVAAIEARLPQTQCGQCQYPGCHAYATAVAEGEAIDRCPPGGDVTQNALSQLLNRPLERVTQTSHGAESSEMPVQVARIREPECLGCTLCIKVCPVDAIIGAQGCLHGVLEDQCTGCELCLAACPVDCIDLLERSEDAQARRVPRTKALAEPLGCIRCGRCDDICPRNIPVRALWWSIRQNAHEPASLDPGAQDCIACGLCDTHCPSGISLAQPILRQAAQERAHESARQEAERALKLFDITSVRRDQEVRAAKARREQRLRRRRAGGDAS